MTGDDFLLIPATVAANAQAQLQAALTTSQSIASAGRSGQPAMSPYVVQGGPFGTNVPGGSPVS